MALTKQEYLDRLAEIGTCTDDVTRRSLLTTITDEASILFDSNSNLLAENDRLQRDNDSVRDANMQLFLRVSGRTQDTPIDKTGDEDKTKKLEYENLFDENGGLK